MGRILIPLPLVPQTSPWACGAPCVESITKYYGTAPNASQAILDACRATSGEGTPPKRLIQAARKFGLRTRQHHELSVPRLQHYLDAGYPVVCLVWAHGTGHYVVAVGYDEKQFYFMDPNTVSAYGYMTYRLLRSRWYDWSVKTGEVFIRYGIRMWADTEPVLIRKRSRFKEIR